MKAKNTISTESIYEESLKLHKKLKGAIEIKSKMRLRTAHDLSLLYTPGVAGVAGAIVNDTSQAFELTIKHNTVAVVSDGSAVLGLGNIGPYSAIPIMEGKALLFKEYADINAFPLCLQTQKSNEIIQIIKNIAPVFSGINLEDISAPRCFEIEDALQDIGIPVFHDDQHGSAIVVLAALINASKVAGKQMQDLVVVVNGAGAAGTAITKLLRCVGQDKRICERVKEVLVCDSKGILYIDRRDINNNPYKLNLAKISNQHKKQGSLKDAMKGADVFIGVSRGNLVTPEMIKSMNTRPIIIAMANPIPEIMPDVAINAGAFIVGTGRSDYPNQVNNVLAFPGIFRGAIDVRARTITNGMKIAAAFALSKTVPKPTRDKILPSPLDKTIVKKIAHEVSQAYLHEAM